MKRFFQGKKLTSLFLSVLIAMSFPLSGSALGETAGEVKLECESMVPVTSGGGAQYQVKNDAAYSGGAICLIQNSAGVTGHWMQAVAAVPAAGTYELYITTKDNPDRGIYTVTADGGATAVGTLDLYSANTAGEFREHYIGKYTFASTTAAFTFKCTGNNAAGTGKGGMAADFMRLVPVPSAVSYEGESLPVAETDGSGDLNGPMTLAGANGGSAYRFQPKDSLGVYADGKYVTFRFPTPAPGTYDLIIHTKTYSDRGRYQVNVNGTDIGILDGYAATASFVDISVGKVTFTGSSPGTSTIKFTGAGRNDAVAAGKCTYSMILDTLTFSPASPEQPAAEPTVLGVRDSSYGESGGTWADGAAVGYESSPTRISADQSASAVWSIYPPDLAIDTKQNYDVYAYMPDGLTDGAKVKYTVNTLQGMWSKVLDQSTGGGWVKLNTVQATGGTVLSVSLGMAQSGGKIYAANIKLQETTAAADPVTPVGGGTDANGVYVFVNQTGYDTEKAKRATVVNVPDGTAFSVKKAGTGETAFTGTVKNNVADFTSLQPDTKTDYYVECGGAVSYTFTVDKYWMQRVSVVPALNFMSQSRQDTFEVGGNTGYGWRDSHQFSFELNSLVLQYMANPSLYNTLPHNIYKPETCEYADLRVQDEPDIVWLMEFAAERYCDWAENKGVKLHLLIKEQLAYFLYIYPQIKQYVPQGLYTKARDLAIAEWSDPDCNKSWYEVAGTNHNLFATQTVIGGIKGALPPGNAIVPNLMMYEVVRRDGLGDGQPYFDAAYNNCKWLIENKDITSVELSKGQRMSEHIVMENLAYFQEMYPDKAPKGLLSAIEYWADKVIARSGNEWDMRMAQSVAAGDSADYWTGAGWAYATGQYTSIMNEPGNEAGVQAITYAASRVLTDSSKAERLKEIGLAGIDDMFGRNPTGRAFFYNVTTDIPGGDKGWFTFLQGGYGALANVAGRIDGSSKESAYPFNPNADKGYTEGWVAYNTAWNASLAYSAAADVAVSTDKTAVNAGDTVKVTLKAPLNMDDQTVEQGQAVVKNVVTGEEQLLTLTEDGKDSYTFSGLLVTPSATAILEISYGYGLFKQSCQVFSKGGDYVPVQSVSLNRTELLLGSGMTEQLAVSSVVPENASFRLVKWSSSDSGIATVTENGEVRGVSAGTAVITAQPVPDPGAQASCSVTVSGAVPASLVVSADAAQIKPYESTQIRIPAMKLSDGSTKSFSGTAVQYVPQDRNLISVNDSGQILGKRGGTTTVTVSAAVDGITVSGSVNVTVVTSGAKVKTEFSTGIASASNPAALGTSSQGGGFSGSEVVTYKPASIPAWVEFTLPSTEAGDYRVLLTAKRYNTYGVYQVLMDGVPLGDPVDFSQGAVGSFPTLDLGVLPLNTGTHTIRFTAQNVEAGKTYSFAPDYVELEQQYPQYPPAADRNALKVLIDECDQLLQGAAAGDGNGQYPQSAMDDFSQSVESARQIYEMEEPAQSILNLGATSLQLARGSFLNAVITVDTKELVQAIEQAEQLTADPDQYLEDGKTAFASALQTAKNILANPLSSQADVNAAAASLKNAGKALKLKPQAVRIADSGTGVTVSAGAGILPEDAQMLVQAVHSGSGFDLAARALKDVSTEIRLYDISVLSGGIKVQPQNGNITIRIPIPQGFNREKLALFHIADNGVKMQIPFTLDGNMIIFTSAHLSYYAIADTSAKPGSENSDGNENTGNTGSESSGAPGTNTGGNDQSAGESGKGPGSPGTGERPTGTMPVLSIFLVSALAAICLMKFKNTAKS